MTRKSSCAVRFASAWLLIKLIFLLYYHFYFKSCCIIGYFMKMTISVQTNKLDLTHNYCDHYNAIFLTCQNNSKFCQNFNVKSKLVKISTLGQNVKTLHKAKENRNQETTRLVLRRLVPLPSTRELQLCPHSQAHRDTPPLFCMCERNFDCEVLICSDPR